MWSLKSTLGQSCKLLQCVNNYIFSTYYAVSSVLPRNFFKDIGISVIACLLQEWIQGYREGYSQGNKICNFYVHVHNYNKARKKIFSFSGPPISVFGYWAFLLIKQVWLNKKNNKTLILPFDLFVISQCLCSKASTQPFSCMHLTELDLLKVLLGWLCYFRLRPYKLQLLSAHDMAIKGHGQCSATHPSYTRSRKKNVIHRTLGST